MRVVLHDRHGGPEVLEEATAPDPVAGPGEAVVGVRACAVNRLDLLQREAPLIPGFSLPHVPGMDIAGAVVSVGADADADLIGSEVVVDPVVPCGRCARCAFDLGAHCPDLRAIGSTTWGGYAEQVLVPIANLHRMPDGLDAVAASGLPTAYLTAWLAMIEVGAVRPGEHVLIMGASSAVTIAAVRLARRVGAIPVTTAGSDRALDRARSTLDVAEVVDRRTDDLTERLVGVTGGDGFDVVFDHVGPAQLQRSIDVLRIGGRLVIGGTTTGRQGTFDLPSLYHHGRTIIGLGGKRRDTFAAMMAAVREDPTLRMEIDDVLPLGAAADAHRRIEAGDFFGKLVLLPDG